MNGQDSKIQKLYMRFELMSNTKISNLLHRQKCHLISFENPLAPPASYSISNCIFHLLFIHSHTYSFHNAMKTSCLKGNKRLRQA